MYAAWKRLQAQNGRLPKNQSFENYLLNKHVIIEDQYIVAGAVKTDKEKVLTKAVTGKTPLQKVDELLPIRLWKEQRPLR